MTKIKTFALASALLLAGYSQAQTLNFNGHTYAALPALSLVDAREAAKALGGHLIYVQSEAEWAFVDANFIRNGSGSWWTGMIQNGGRWINDNRSFNHYIPSVHWLEGIQTFPFGSGSVIVLGKIRGDYKSKKASTKLYQFDRQTALESKCRSIVEFEFLLDGQGINAESSSQ